MVSKSIQTAGVDQLLICSGTGYFNVLNKLPTASEYQGHRGNNSGLEMASRAARCWSPVGWGFLIQVAVASLAVLAPGGRFKGQ